MLLPKPPRDDISSTPNSPSSMSAKSPSSVHSIRLLSQSEFENDIRVKILTSADLEMFETTATRVHSPEDTIKELYCM